MVNSLDATQDYTHKLNISLGMADEAAPMNFRTLCKNRLIEAFRGA
jgi:hypothetical protein